METKKTDNHALGLKVALREEFLNRYHPRGGVVFDGCMGSGQIWKRLKPGRALVYWGVDVKPARGRVKIDSERVLTQPGWDFDIVDVDTYGMPWGHWLAILKNGKKPLTVFLTVGTLKMPGFALCHEIREVLGLGNLKIPSPFGAALVEDFILEMIGVAAARGWRIVETKEAVPYNPSTARYFGVRIEPL